MWLRLSSSEDKAELLDMASRVKKLVQRLRLGNWSSLSGMIEE
ncbi:MAG: hypothetical protein NZ872_04980 [Archaeoglobaceae archaeon]|nr:hypothetical protein [Archaeoglobaceae archaeon]MDW8128553.1 hypothetical protein [Archaeoglobaceae archaeon]